MVQETTSKGRRTIWHSSGQDLQHPGGPITAQNPSKTRRIDMTDAKQPSKAPSKAPPKKRGRKPVPLDQANRTTLTRKTKQALADHVVALRDANEALKEERRELEELIEVFRENVQTERTRADGLQEQLDKSDRELKALYEGRDALHISVKEERALAAKFHTETEELRMKLKAEQDELKLMARRNDSLTSEINGLQAERRGMRETVMIFADALSGK